MRQYINAKKIRIIVEFGLLGGLSLHKNTLTAPS